MSDNPFAAPVNPSDPDPNQQQLPSGPEPAPGGLTAICILCLILGFFGLAGSCIGGISLAFQPAVEGFVNDNFPDGPDKELQKITLAVQKNIRVPGLILAGLNLIVGGMLFIGSIGTLRRKDSSRNLLRTGLLAAVFYSIIKIVFSVYNAAVTPTAMRAELAKLADDPDFSEIESRVEMAAMFTLGGAAFGVVIALCIIGFYVWSRSYLNRSEIAKLFS